MPRLFLGLFLGAMLAFVPAFAQETPPNFVILFADDLGINDLGCFGRKDQNTPNLDKLAAEGARFTQAYAAASVCSPSRAGLLTGQSPARLKITTFLTGRTDRASHRVLGASLNYNLPDGVQTIAQLLKPKGYASAAVGKWHLGGKGHQPTDHGFDEYFAGKANAGAESPQGGKGELGQADYAVKFIQKNKAKPFFLYLAFDNPHIPLAAPAKGIEANAKSFHPTYARRTLSWSSLPTTVACTSPSSRKVRPRSTPPPAPAKASSTKAASGRPSSSVILDASRPA
jgi:arylsulfatase A